MVQLDNSYKPRKSRKVYQIQGFHETDEDYKSVQEDPNKGSLDPNKVGGDSAMRDDGDVEEIKA